MTEQELREAGRRVELDEIQRVVDNGDGILKKASSGRPVSLLTEVGQMLSLVRDYWSGSYRHIPYWALGAIVVALLYILNPTDLVPDLMPAASLVDDAAVLGLCLKMVEQELKLYGQWKAARAE